ncbi:hypothetical protein ACHHYP_05287, partial [Achlya hypogyna]
HKQSSVAPLERQPCTLRLVLRRDCSLTPEQVHALHAAGLGVIDVERDHGGYCSIGRDNLLGVFPDPKVHNLLSRFMCTLSTQVTRSGYSVLLLANYSSRRIFVNNKIMPKNSSIFHPLHEGDTVVLFESDQENILAYCVAEARDGADIGILFASPLVELDAAGTPTPLSELDYRTEYDSLREAIDSVATSYSRTTVTTESQGTNAILTMPTRVNLHIRLATKESFRLWSASLTVLHFTGHGNDQWMYVEDPMSGAAVPVSPVEIAALLPEKLSLRLVFLSSCASANIAWAFLSRGVRHVVATKAESELEDKAAIVFTRRFYTSLATGRSVQEAFDAAQAAVANLHSTSNPDAVAQKFLLLPLDGDHSAVLFPPVETRALAHDDDDTPDGFPTQSQLQAEEDARTLSPSSPPTSLAYESSVPSLSSGFGFRNVDMYRISLLLQRHRIVTLTGAEGIGKTQLAIALAHYTDLRQAERHRVRVASVDGLIARGDRGDISEDHCVRLIMRLQEQLRTMEDASLWPALVVLDGVDVFGSHAGWVARLELYLSYLLVQHATVRIVLTAREPLPWPPLAVAKATYTVPPLALLESGQVLAKLLDRPLRPRQYADLGLREPEVVPAASDLPALLAQSPVLQRTQGIPLRITTLFHDLEHNSP